jgi:Terminase large subunit, T4likevirus-type, N-terminal
MLRSAIVLERGSGSVDGDAAVRWPVKTNPGKLFFRQKSPKHNGMGLASEHGLLASRRVPNSPFFLTQNLREWRQCNGYVQAGKSTVAAALALRVALLQPGSPILVLSPTNRQSGELFRKILSGYRALGRPLPATAETLHHLELANGSRILSLPGSEKTVRCFSGVSLLIIDEAARVDDALYYAVRPMLAVSKGRLIALSTPFGKRGWFHDAWHSQENWHRLRITAVECPRITPEFLAEERQALGERWFRQEFLCSFEEVIDAVFAYADIQAALSEDVQPLFQNRT